MPLQLCRRHPRSPLSISVRWLPWFWCIAAGKPSRHRRRTILHPKKTIHRRNPLRPKIGNRKTRKTKRPQRPTPPHPNKRAAKTEPHPIRGSRSLETATSGFLRSERLSRSSTYRRLKTAFSAGGRDGDHVHGFPRNRAATLKVVSTQGTETSLWMLPCGPPLPIRSSAATAAVYA